jgi:hypothetical protein
MIGAGRCAHCDTRIERSEPFTFRDHEFCCECMMSLCSWLLDGGMVEEPAMFSYVLEPGDGP